MIFVGKVVESKTKRISQIYTTKPGIQIYSANFYDGVKGYQCITLACRRTLAFETQYFPDNPNITHFPSKFIYLEKLKPQILF